MKHWREVASLSRSTWVTQLTLINVQEKTYLSSPLTLHLTSVHRFKEGYMLAVNPNMFFYIDVDTMFVIIYEINGKTDD